VARCPLRQSRKPPPLPPTTTSRPDGDTPNLKVVLELMELLHPSRFWETSAPHNSHCPGPQPLRVSAIAEGDSDGWADRNADEGQIAMASTAGAASLMLLVYIQDPVVELIAHSQNQMGVPESSPDSKETSEGQ